MLQVLVHQEAQVNLLLGVLPGNLVQLHLMSLVDLQAICQALCHPLLQVYLHLEAHLGHLVYLHLTFLVKLHLMSLVDLRAVCQAICHL